MTNHNQNCGLLDFKVGHHTPRSYLEHLSFSGMVASRCQARAIYIMAGLQKPTGTFGTGTRMYQLNTQDEKINSDCIGHNFDLFLYRKISVTKVKIQLKSFSVMRPLFYSCTKDQIGIMATNILGVPSSNTQIFFASEVLYSHQFPACTSGQLCSLPQ